MHAAERSMHAHDIEHDTTIVVAAALGVLAHRDLLLAGLPCHLSALVSAGMDSADIMKWAIE
jgi:hypothetical protein